MVGRKINILPLSGKDLQLLYKTLGNYWDLYSLLIDITIVVTVVLTLWHSRSMHFATQLVKFGIAVDTAAYLFVSFRPMLEFIIRRKMAGSAKVLFKYKSRGYPRVFIVLERPRFIPVGIDFYDSVKRKERIYVELGLTTSSIVYALGKVGEDL